jgi:tRNA (adenine22-N1)-methyltransferase
MNNKRLEAIADIFEQNIVIDIGSDHGYLPIHLVSEKICQEAIIIEVNDGPIRNATNNVSKHGLKNKISIHKSDGLKKFDIVSYATAGVVIAGMGGSLIKSIINNDLDKFKLLNLYLQPNNNEFQLRKFLIENNFEITYEFLIEEDGIIYPIIKAIYNPSYEAEYSDSDFLFGKAVEKNLVFLKKWKNEQKHLTNLCSNLRENGYENKKLEYKLQLINNKLEEK